MGARVQQRTGWKVDLENPEFTVFIDVAQEGIFVYTEKQRGLGGLPVGASGKLICLLSGGIDSPVAAFKMFRRGCKVVFVHFFNYSRDAREVRDKVVRIVQILSRYQSTSRLYLVPFAGLQQALVTVVPSQDRMVAYRRIMLRIAGAILEKEGAKGFITGDSVGQVASQTLDNLHTIYQAARYPVFAPLIGENKLAIMELARRIGTYEASILPYSDCCQFLVAKHPETKVSLEQAEACEERFPLDTYCEEAFRTAEVLEIGVSGTTGGQVS
jgi:thiamine biosynthesis protein ThiI